MLRFPAEQRKVELLILRDSDFRELCEELADAEAALLAAGELPMAIREERTAEWTASVERLATEIARILKESSVTRTGWLPHLKRHP